MSELQQINSQLKKGISLSFNEIEISIENLLSSQIEEKEKIDFLLSLSKKRETIEEIFSFAQIFLKKANPFPIKDLPKPSIDVCGTGGDNVNLFNISTTSMFVVAAAGAKVIKHGNRKITSSSGSADVLEELGIPPQIPEKCLQACLEESNLAFLFAPAYHPCFAKIAPIRQKIAKKGQTSIFNFLGPLLNPAKPEYQLIGVKEKERMGQFLNLLQKLGRKGSWVVCGETEEGKIIDELSLMGTSYIQTSKKGTKEKFLFSPNDFNLKKARLKQLQGGEAKENAKILLKILTGEDKGMKKEMIILNAGAMIACCELANNLEEGIGLAKEFIENGKALQCLKKLQKTIQKYI